MINETRVEALRQSRMLSVNDFEGYVFEDLLGGKVCSEEKFEYMVYFLLAATDSNDTKQQDLLYYWFSKQMQNGVCLGDIAMIYNALNACEAEDNGIFDTCEGILLKTEMEELNLSA